jgi:CRISPR-associated protein Cas1
VDVLLTTFGSALGKTSRRFTVRRPDAQTVELPAEQVRHITVVSRGVSLSSDAVKLAMDEDAVLAFLEPSGEPYAVVVAPAAFGRADLRRMQLEAADDERGAGLARAFIDGKLRNQAATLRYFAKSRRKTAPETHASLTELAGSIDALAREAAETAAEDNGRLRVRLMNLEARAAKAYWEGFRLLLPEDVGFAGRVRKGATDPFNVCLNYAYGILYTRLWSLVVAAGLDPYAGFLHGYARSRPVLVFDLIEEFRSFVADRPVAASFLKQWRPALDEDGTLARESRATLGERVLERIHGRVNFRGKVVEVEAVMKAQTYALTNVIQGTGHHAPYVATW